MDRTRMIRDELTRRLDAGQYPPGSKFPPETVLAEEFKVSKLTINKIVAMISESGRLIRGKSGAGTLVAPSFFHPRGHLFYLGPLLPYASRAVSGFQAECVLRGYFPVIFNPGSEEISRCLQMLNSKNAAGAVSMQLGILPPAGDLNMFFLDYPMNHVCIRPHLHYLDSDNYNGARELMKKILEHGHREIVIFSSQRYFFTPEAPVPARVRGFQDVLREAGMTDEKERTFYANLSLNETQIVLKKILKKYPSTTVICTDSDDGADLIHTAAAQMGLSIPGETALTGFGNITSQQIPTVDQHPELQGQLAARFLIDFAEGKLSDSTMIDEKIPATLVNIGDLPVNLNHSS